MLQGHAEEQPKVQVAELLKAPVVMAWQFSGLELVWNLLVLVFVSYFEM